MIVQACEPGLRGVGEPSRLATASFLSAGAKLFAPIERATITSAKARTSYWCETFLVSYPDGGNDPPTSVANHRATHRAAHR